MVDKPVGWTSHDVVGKVRRLFDTQRVGHAGTLDPPASGVLVLCLGSSTRLLEYLTGCDKAYRGEVVLGAVTDTYDDAGTVLETAAASALTADQVAAALATFVGTIGQIPPMVSAKKVGGRPLHQLARQGKVIERAACQVQIHEARLTSFTPGELAVAAIEVVCGPGTYIRSLAHDLGLMLGVGGHLRKLCRTRVGDHRLDEAHSLSELGELAPPERCQRLLGPQRAVAHLPQVIVAAAGLLPLRQGKVLGPELLLAAPPEQGPLALLSADGELLAIAAPVPGGVHPEKVLVS
ncbi:MAG: tRNA pseudouridine(55) synthase TruB [Fimbriimonadaceae bacterium]|nr:tRNA pseudouridine(55) synthase TruB [Fimbriimonadaceae bacterium]